MLIGQQKIIYRRNGELILELTPENVSQIPFEWRSYIRYVQPFIVPGLALRIPHIDPKKAMVTTDLRSAERKDNSLEFRTKNSTYTVEYKLIDIARVLEDGSSGVNAHKTGEIKPFPI